MNVHVSAEIASDKARPSVGAIARLVATRRNITFADLISHRRMNHLARARMEAMYFSKRLANRTMPEIGRVLGGRDHTTILSGIRRIETLAAEDGAYLAELNAIEHSIVADLGTTYVFSDTAEEARNLAAVILESKEALQISLSDIRNLAAMFIELERRDARLVPPAPDHPTKPMTDAEIIHYVPTRSIPVSDLQPLLDAVARMEGAVYTPGEAHQRSRVIREAVELKKRLGK